MSTRYLLYHYVRPDLRLTAPLSSKLLHCIVCHFSERFVVFRTVLCVRLERFEMILTQRLFIYFSKRTSASASVIVIVTFINKTYQKTNRVMMTHEQFDPLAL